MSWQLQVSTSANQLRSYHHTAHTSPAGLTETYSERESSPFACQNAQILSRLHQHFFNSCVSVVSDH